MIYIGSKVKKIFLIIGMLFTVNLAHAADVSSWDDWKMRTEIALDATTDRKPLYSVETVQPLYRAFDRQNTLLMQLRVAVEAEKLLEKRYDFNLGLGYRKLLAENSAMAGLKLFYDNESQFNLGRWSIGADLSWKVFDLYANQYSRFTYLTNTNVGPSEKPLNGYDVDVAVQVPYMPWAKVHAMHYQWERARAAETIIGKKVSIEGALSLNWTLELGQKTVNVVDNDKFILLRYRWSGFVREHQNAMNNFISSSAFEMRDMKDYTLERLRRSNNIEVGHEP